jgi:putative nucleotidyltransferase with HDIG domain
MSEASPLTAGDTADTGDAIKEETPVSVLCVDDEENILTSLTRLFRNEPFKTLTANSGEAGLAILKNTENVALILSDFRMPEMNGAEFLKAAAEIAPDSHRMIITGYADAKSAIAAINEGGVSRFLTKPFNNKELIQAVADGLSRYRLIHENRRLTELVRQKNEELAEWNDNLKKRVLQQTTQIRGQIEIQKKRSAEFCSAMAQTFIELIDQRDTWLSKHSRTVAALTDQITQKLGLGAHLCEEIRVAALLHDIGMMGMPDRILAKRTQVKGVDELKEFQSHSIKGQAAVENIEILREVGLMIRHHHEAYDGSGYPDGLVGEQIPLGARIISVANWIENTFAKEASADAKYLVSKRLDREMGRSFDPQLTVAAKFAVTQVLTDQVAIRQDTEEEIAIGDLQAGMILSRNLCTSTGLLLLERGTRLTYTTVENVQHRHKEFSKHSRAFIWNLNSR